MMWVFKILFNKRLKEQEGKRRQALIHENNLFTDELKKLKLMRNIVVAKDPNDLELNLLKSLDIDDIIKKITAINFSFNLILFSAKDVDKAMKQVRNMKRAVKALIEMSQVTEKIDGFFELKLPKNSIFEKNEAKFTTAVDSFQRLKTAQ